MFSAAELLEVLRRRRTLKSIRPDEPGRLPPGWEAWLAAMPERVGAVTGALPGAFVDQFLQRVPAPPPRRSAALTRWQAFATLWRQQWQPAMREERGLRIFAMSTSLVVHLAFAVLLAWLMYLHFLVLLATPPGGEAAVVEVEFVGTGTPEDAGGGAVPPVRETTEPAPQVAAASPAPAPAPTPAPVEMPAAPASVPPLPELPVAVESPPVAATMPPVPQRDVPQPEMPEAAQPLQVTIVERPDIEFVLPSASTGDTQVRRPELAVPVRDVPTPEVVEALEAELPSGLPTVAIDAPDLAPAIPGVSERAVPAPAAAPRVPTRPLPGPVVSVPSPAARVPGVTVATIPAPTGAGAEAASGEQAEGAAETGAVDAGTLDTGAATASGAEAATPGAQASDAVAGAGPEPAAAPGGWPSPSRGDDWDDALRNRPGGQADGGTGLFDGTGQPRVAGTGDAGSSPGSAPPGSEARQAIDLERGGSWLRRPPLDYRPTRFDAFWIPSGTLLEEWVRRGIKQMSIPIPGTSMEIVCVVSILQLGGGCGLSNPNVNDQPSSGRPAPDVPFKPELQEDQDSLARPPGG